MRNLAQLKRLRWAVRVVLFVGVAASVAANILHANPNPISQTIAAWPSLAFLLTVELTSRIPVTRRLRAAVRIVATAVIAGIAGWVSYWHMADVAARYGESTVSAHLLPFTVDGLIVVCSVSLVELAVKIASLIESVPLVVEAKPAPAASPVSPGVGPSTAPPVTVARVQQLVRPSGRSGPQIKGPSKPSPLTGRVLMEETPQP